MSCGSLSRLLNKPGLSFLQGDLARPDFHAGSSRFNPFAESLAVVWPPGPEVGKVVGTTRRQIDQVIDLFSQKKYFPLLFLLVTSILGFVL